MNPNVHAPRLPFSKEPVEQAAASRQANRWLEQRQQWTAGQFAASEQERRRALCCAFEFNGVHGEMPCVRFGRRALYPVQGGGRSLSS